MNNNLSRLLNIGFRIFAAVIILAANFLILPVPAKADSETQEYLVKFKDEKRASAIIAEKNGEEKAGIEKLNVHLLNLSKDQAEELSRDERVEYIESNYQVKASSIHNSYTVPNDPGYSAQYGLTSIYAPYAWDYSQGAGTIAILDTGIDGTHIDLSGKVLAGHSFISGLPINANTDSDDNGHGTAVAGVAAAYTNNGVGMAGTCWNCNLMPVKVLDAVGNGTDLNVAAGIIWAADSGAKVINMSLGGPDYSQTMANAIAYAWAGGLILVAASGNSGLGVVEYPAANSYVIAVGATSGADGQRWASSNYGANLDLMAPGVSIYSTQDNGGYNYYTGTSLATPFAAGVAAAALSFQPAPGNGGIANIMIGNCLKDWMGGVYWNTTYGYGRVNYYGSLINPAAGSYSYQYVTQDGFPTIIPGQAYNFTLQIRNTGQTVWTRGAVNLGTDRGQDRISAFIREGDGPSGWISGNRVVMQQASVAPGQVATFSFWMRAPSGMSPGTYREYFKPVADGIGWMQDYGIYWDINVVSAPPAYSYQYLTQDGYPTLAPGQSYNFTLSILNTGTATWARNAVNLGTDRGQDRISAFIREGDGPSGWITGNRVAMQQASVAPGQTATFSFWMRAPAGMSPGTYREYFKPVADGIGWMQDYGIYWDVRVN